MLTQKLFIFLIWSKLAQLFRDIAWKWSEFRTNWFAERSHNIERRLGGHIASIVYQPNVIVGFYPMHHCNILYSHINSKSMSDIDVHITTAILFRCTHPRTNSFCATTMKHTGTAWNQSSSNKALSIDERMWYNTAAAATIKIPINDVNRSHKRETFSIGRRTDNQRAV